MLDEPWSLNGSVALRPEPFGALAYDFSTRRLTFLKDPMLVRVVRALAGSPTAAQAMDDAQVPLNRREEVVKALRRLADQGMISRRTS